MNGFFELLMGGLTFVAAAFVGALIITPVMFAGAWIFVYFYKKYNK